MDPGDTPSVSPVDYKQYLTARLPGYLAMLEQMVLINSHTGNRNGVNALGDLTAARFETLGFSAERVAAEKRSHGNHLLLSREAREEQGPTIALVSHLDTVYTPEEEIDNNFGWQNAGERVYGPGTVDIKGGTVLMYMVLDALKALATEHFEQTNWLLMFDAAEEVLAPNFRRMMRQRVPADALGCLIFESGYLERGTARVVTGRKGMVTFRVDVAGRSAHAGNEHRSGANAIVQLAHTVSRIASLTSYQEDVTFNIGVIKGGLATNRVPHHSSARGELRCFTVANMEKAVASLKALQDDNVVSSHDGTFECRVSIEILGTTQPWPQNAGTESLLKIWQEAGESMGLEVVAEQRSGLSDGNGIWNHVPTLDGLGPHGANAHCSERSADGSKLPEYVLPESFVPKATLNCLAIISMIDGRRRSLL